MANETLTFRPSKKNETILAQLSELAEQENFTNNQNKIKHEKTNLRADAIRISSKRTRNKRAQNLQRKDKSGRTLQKHYYNEGRKVSFTFGTFTTL